MPPNWPSSLVIRALFLTAFGAWLPGQLNAAAPIEARLTHVMNDVQLVNIGKSAEGDPLTSSNVQPRAASVDEIVTDLTLVRTGADSRAELSFTDETVVRLAANTSLCFEGGTRAVKLTEGAALLQAPRRAKSARLHAAGVTVAIAGTTVTLEHRSGTFKLLALEGTSRVYRPGHLGDSLLVRPGQMVIGKTDAPLSDPVDFDIARFMKTSRFVLDFPPLRSESGIAAASQKQEQEKLRKTLIDTNLVIFGGGTAVSLLGPAGVEGSNNRAAPEPSPHPSSGTDPENLGPID